MDADSLERMLESERFTLRQTVAALRWEESCPGDADDRDECRQRLAFLSELLHRHAQQLFGLIDQSSALQFAVEWQSPSYCPSRLDDPELLHKLDGILDAAHEYRLGDPRRVDAERGHLEPLLDRIERYLDEEQTAWESSRAPVRGAAVLCS